MDLINMDLKSNSESVENEPIELTKAQDIQYDWDISSEINDSSVTTEIINDAESFSFELNHYDEKIQEDMLWQARTGLNPDSLCGAIETIIFMSDKPISIQKIKAQIDQELPLRVIHDSLQRLQTRYEEKLHGIRLVEVAQGYQFRTKATYSKFVQNLFKINSLVLTPSAIEVLAIIAYKQPISKTEVEKIRGVDSSHIIRALMDKRLVKIMGRSEELGRPSVFGTTEEFLEVFNLTDISALPPEYELEEMAMKNTVGSISDIKSVVFRSETSKKFGVDETEELDQLAASIQKITADTDFTILLKSEDKKKIEGETVVRKSAFDILEDFINKDQSVQQNIAAQKSEVLSTPLEPKVIDISLTDVIFNAPQVDQELETLLAQETDFPLAENAIDENQQIEARELERALDEAFEKLTGEKFSEDSLDEIQEHNINDLDATIERVISQGQDFDLDLSFLNEVSLPHTEIEGE